MMTYRNSLSVPWFIFSLLGALILRPPHSEAAGQDDGFRVGVRTDVVELFITARAGGQFLSGLEPADLLVLEDGRVQNLAFLESEQLPVCVGLLLDTSGSMTKDLRKLQFEAIRFLQSLRPNDEVTIVSFGGTVKALTPLTRDQSVLSEGILRLYAEGNTPLYDAVAKTLDRMHTINGRTAVVVFTDGLDNGSHIPVDVVVRESGKHAIPIFVVGTGEALRSSSSRADLKEMAERTGGKAYFLKTSRDLEEAFLSISETLSRSYRAGYYSSIAADGLWHEISVALTSKKGQVRTRRGYYAR